VTGFLSNGSREMIVSFVGLPFCDVVSFTFYIIGPLLCRDNFQLMLLARSLTSKNVSKGGSSQNYFSSKVYMTVRHD
jgi:hypothetical protein